MPIRSQAATATASSPRPSSGSPAKTVAQRRSRSSRMCSVTNSHARSAAPSLKYSPDREVAEHLEEREMARRQADLVDVGRPEALLDGREELRRRLFEPEEVRLQGLHARRREQHGRVVGRGDERRRRAPEVALGLEEGEKALSQLCGRAHSSILGAAAHGDLFAHLLERAADQARDVHLRDAHLRGDLGLGEALPEAEVDDQPLALVEDVEPGLENGTVLARPRTRARPRRATRAGRARRPRSGRREPRAKPWNRPGPTRAPPARLLP